jgi:putative ABC transport system permease protein
MTAERKKEFALLRAAGASGKMLSEIVMAEGSILSVAGSAVSIGIMLVLLPAFLSRAGQAMNLPLPAPGAGRCAVSAVIAVGISVLAGMAGCVMMARRISRMDAASALREV